MTTLEETIETLEIKAERKKGIVEVEQRLERAKRALNRISDSVAELAERLQELSYYDQVLTRVFDDGSRLEDDLPESDREQLGAVHDRVDECRRRANDAVPTRENVVQILTDPEENPDDYETAIESVTEAVEETIDEARDALESIQRVWKTKIEATHGVMRIVGEQATIESTLNDMEQLLFQRMWKTTSDVNQLAREWESYLQTWDQQGLDWEEFQTTHGLGDETIDRLRELSNGNELRLGDLPEEVITDLIGVEELGAEIKLSL